ncbi:hypothetical protein N476_01940 [Pseudoalteromonas luteoviolacea H33]|uniref:Uncharacterized protein n=1 Tax=Pseudoalteromonas luteoviolacea H33 TaxID=1365251 RepID=A0A161Y8D0_9GAMM|nr:hypothetical protein N476_01940 [Pseudoalteromonas luteoviolacea H33]KZN78835.1 hypothetical protein N477_08415 [Pseudoalteromonas luteoviolacea H33-S]
MHWLDAGKVCYFFNFNDFFHIFHHQKSTRYVWGYAVLIEQISARINRLISIGVAL